jgi:hypothetical protein
VNVLSISQRLFSGAQVSATTVPLKVEDYFALEKKTPDNSPGSHEGGIASDSRKLPGAKYETHIHLPAIRWYPL